MAIRKGEDLRPLSPGTVLDGKYTIQAEIGRDRYWIKYLAINHKLGNILFTVKYIPRTAECADALKKAVAEVRIMAGLSHPGIPSVVDLIEEEDAVYIVRDFVAGMTVHQHLMNENGNIPEDTVINWGLQLCDILGYLHSQRLPIIYHDLKPGNIILEETERRSVIKLEDFGEARWLINGDAPGSGYTPSYASPEQMTKGAPTDQRSDIFTLGTTMYRLLTGAFFPRNPEASTSIRTAFPQLKISRELDAIISKCTEPNPKDRFQSMGEVEAALKYAQKKNNGFFRRLGKRNAATVIALFLTGAMLTAGFAANSDIYNNEYENINVPIINTLGGEING